MQRDGNTLTLQGPAHGVVLITGGSRGIGAACARRVATLGQHVLIAYADNADAAESLRQEIAGRGGSASTCRADVGDEQGVLALFRAVEASGLPLAGLVNNAAVSGGFSRLEALRDDALRRVLAVNVAGAVLCAREAVRRLSTRQGGQGGSIVNVSSLAAKLGSPGEWIHYAASKGAIDTLTVGLAREVATEGIRVNAVAPGLIDTDFHAAAGAPERVAALAPSTPMQRAGTPAEVADAIVWLMSTAAAYITGAVLPVGGGR